MNPELLFQQAQAQHQQGQLIPAETTYRELLKRLPDHALGMHFLGILLAQKQAYTEALPLLEKACLLQPGNWSFLTNLGEARFRAGHLDLAEQAYRQALQIKPDFAEAHFNLANLLKQIGQNEAAIQHYRATLRTQPQHLKALYNLSNSLRQAGQYRSAIECFQKLLKLSPGHADAHNNLGATLKEFDDLPAALLHYQFANWLKPQSKEALLNLAQLQATLGQIDASRQLFADLRAQEPDNLSLQLMQMSICSSIAFNNYEIDAYRQNLVKELQVIIASGRHPDLLSDDAQLCQPSFELAYQGRDDKEIKALYAQVFAPAMPITEARAKHSGKQKIGFVVTAGHEGVFIKCMKGILQRFSVAEAELVVVCRQPNGAKILSAGLARDELQFLELPVSLGEAIHCLQTAQFDLLYYWESGTDALNYFLPYCRLARVQCNAWGWPVTSGIPNMDIFLSMQGVESPDSASHYSEQLIQLPHLATCYSRPPVPERLTPRSAFALPPDAHWYLCSQNLRKIHPDYDALVAEVLRQDPKGIFLVTGSKLPVLNQLLLRRLQSFHPELAERIFVLPNQPEADYLSLVAHAEVILDTLYYTGGANTNYDAFACGTPVITLPTRFHRGRFTAAAYAQMGVSGCVASDHADYVSKALQMGTDPASRQQKSQQILEVAVDLFEDLRPVKELEDCLLSLCQQ